MKHAWWMLLFLVTTESGAASAKEQPPWWKPVYTRETAKAIVAFEASKAVKAAKEGLAEDDYVLTETPEAVVVKGDCGVVGCSYEVLVVQRLSTEGANTSTASVLALVRIPAAGREPTVHVVDLKTREP